MGKLPTMAVESSPSISDVLIKAMQNPDIDPERLEKFIDLQFKMGNKQAQVAFNNAMAGFQGDCPIIKKTKKVNFKSKSGSTTNYNYSPLDEIVHIIKPILKKYGLSYTFNIKLTENNNISELVTKIYHNAGHSECFSHFFKNMGDDTRMNDSQRSKSALTFAKRAALENSLGVVTAEEDDDARRAVDSPITEDQVQTINSIVEKLGIDNDKFLNFLKVDGLSELSSYEAKNAILRLKEKRGLK